YCSDDVVAKSSDDVYKICDGVKGAVSKTHATIIATLVPSVTSTAVSDNTNAPTISALGTTTSGFETSMTSPVLTTFQSPVSTTGSEGVASVTSSVTESQSQSPSSMPEASGDEDEDEDEDSNSLSAGGVVGVSLASGLSGSFLIGV